MKPWQKFLSLLLLAGPIAAWAEDAVPAPAPAPAAAASKAPKQSVPNPLAPRFKQVRERIDALFHNRNDAPPPLDPRFNPFRAPGAMPPAVIAATTTPPPPSAEGVAPPAPVATTNLALLQQAVATLKVSGTFEIGGKSHLVINARPYKHGDVVQTQVQGETVYLRVKEISKRTVTLVLNDAEMTLKF